MVDRASRGLLRQRVTSLLALRRTVRGRATALAMLIVAVALAIALAAVLVLFRGQLQAGLDQTLEQQAVDRALLLDQGSEPTALTAVLQEEALVWIGRPDGESLAIGGAIMPLENPVPNPIGVTTTTTLLVVEQMPDEVEKEQMELRLASAQALDGRVVLAGAETEVIDDDVAGLARLFLWSLPVLTALVGLITWIVAGRVLRPVETMRAEAEEITGSSLGARVAVPDTGDEIHELGETLNSMLARIEAHDQTLRDFTADASHELKSPVANLRALVDTSELADPQWASLKGRLTGETDRLHDLVDNLLFLAGDESRSNSAGQERVALDDLLFDEAEVLASTGRVAVDLSGVEPLVVTGRRSDLAQLVRNLADNAARHAENRVWLSAFEIEDRVVLAVDDDGPGIAHDDRQRIFERFTRLDDARARDDGGSGLGLTIVERIARLHNAQVNVTESPHGGARFEVTFSS